MKSCLAKCKFGDILICKSGRGYLVVDNDSATGKVWTNHALSGEPGGYFDGSHIHTISKIIKSKK